MPPPFPDRRAEREKLFAEYLTLPPPARDLIQFLALGGRAQPVKDILDFMAAKGSPDAAGKRINRDGWKNTIKECKTRGVMIDRYSQIDCSDRIREACARHCFSTGNFKPITTLLAAYGKGRFAYYYDDDSTFEIKLRRAVVSGKTKCFFDTLAKNRHADIDILFFPWAKIFNQPFRANEMAGIPEQFIIPVMRSIMMDAQFRLEPAEEVMHFLRSKIDAGRDEDGYLRYLLGSQLLLTGRFGDYDALCASHKRPSLLHAVETAIKGDGGKAAAVFDECLAASRKALRRRQVLFGDWSDVFFILSLIRTGQVENLSCAKKHLSLVFEDQSDRDLQIRFQPMAHLFDHNGFFLRPPRPGALIDIVHLPSDPVHLWFALLTAYWLNEPVSAPKYTTPLVEAMELASGRGYLWIASEMAELLHRLTGEEAYRARAQSMRGGWTASSLVDAVRITEPWERTLDALNLLSSEAAGKKTAAPVRLIWEISMPEDNSPQRYQCIEAREQKLLKNGKWSAGRRLDPAKFLDRRKHSELLTDQDRLVLKTLAQAHPWDFDGLNEAFAALAGHPAVYRRDEPDTRVEITLQEPYLAVAAKRGGYRIVMEPQLHGSDAGYVLRSDTKDRLIVYAIKPPHGQIAKILGDAVTIPTAARETLLNTIKTLSPHISVRTDFEDGLQTSERIEPDCRPAARLSDHEGGLKIELLACPIPGGRLYPVGRGSQTIYETANGKNRHTKRDFPRERKLLSELVDHCPTLAANIEHLSIPVFVSDPAECLEILSELSQAEPGAIVLWQGKKPVSISAVRPGHMSFRIRASSDWFSLDGEVRIDDERVISFRALLDLLDTAQGRFVRLDETHFLALTREFKRRIEHLRAYSTLAGGETRLHPLAALAFDDLAADLPNLSTCDEWKSKVERMHAVLASLPEQPTLLQGSLRDYQRDGFVWLARLSGLGAGACLADDMGLGKTVQAIALLLHRARGGAALVIAPTTVCPNWIDEIRRFAPSLAPALFSEADRGACIAGAGPADVVVCSYGLVNNEAELLAQKAWHTIILDEAQAIKNMATQRSKAVMGLRGDFRLVTTGTPIENHLGELWNMFRFINPGLLGTIEEFNRRFASGIEQRNDPELKHRLKAVISPFILRRLKSQVLDELPPKTEIVIYVDLNDEERALYEALRLNALEELQGNGEAKGRHLRILAQIMKLRRACCHPSLAAPDTGVPGSKLETFGLCVAEMLDNNHRALVFSQFVDHLSLIKDYCDGKGILYLYLDGSTPARERNTRIDAFQKGEGSLFLMSLKAGGVGVNLTAADFVILLDPWWNPAVEDQASARAHRLGQTRPVTIYRLIARGTIEEKILELHKHKRDLAESLLEGGDMSGKISADELMKLIRDTV